jgi:hypothetical protein
MIHLFSPKNRFDLFFAEGGSKFPTPLSPSLSLGSCWSPEKIFLKKRPKQSTIETNKRTNEQTYKRTHEHSTTETNKRNSQQLKWPKQKIQFHLVWVSDDLPTKTSFKRRPSSWEAEEESSDFQICCFFIRKRRFF